MCVRVLDKCQGRELSGGSWQEVCWLCMQLVIECGCQGTATFKISLLCEKKESGIFIGCKVKLVTFILLEDGISLSLY